MKGMSGEQAEALSKKLSEHPEIADAMKALEDNKEVKELFEKIRREKRNIKVFRLEIIILNDLKNKSIFYL
jgi:hypothetical protein